MKILFVTQRPYLPQMTGGAQSSMHELALALGSRGHSVCVFSGLTGKGWLGIRNRFLLKLGSRRAVVDRSFGYDVHRAWNPETAAAEVTATVKPDIVVVHSGSPVTMAIAFQECNVPTVVYLRDVEIEQFGGDPSELRSCALIANSRFTAKWFKERYGLQASVVYPLFRPERYRTESDRSHIVFINPHPIKGSGVAIAVAKACPEIPFLFVESWTLGPTEHHALMDQIGPLANVTMIPRTDDMRQVYGKARLVLAPSQCEEAYGRVATEPQFSAIPVIASQIGGLPEAVGAGGILLAADAPVGDWVDAVRSVWFDDDLHASLGAEARRHSTRAELDPKFQVEQVETILETAIAAHCK